MKCLSHLRSFVPVRAYCTNPFRFVRHLIWWPITPLPGGGGGGWWDREGTTLLATAACNGGRRDDPCTCTDGGGDERAGVDLYQSSLLLFLMAGCSGNEVKFEQSATLLISINIQKILNCLIGYRKASQHIV